MPFSAQRQLAKLSGSATSYKFIIRLIKQELTKEDKEDMHRGGEMQGQSPYSGVLECQGGLKSVTKDSRDTMAGFISLSYGWKWKVAWNSPLIPPPPLLTRNRGNTHIPRTYVHSEYTRMNLGRTFIWLEEANQLGQGVDALNSHTIPY